MSYQKVKLRDMSVKLPARLKITYVFKLAVMRSFQYKCVLLIVRSLQNTRSHHIKVGIYRKVRCFKVVALTKKCLEVFSNFIKHKNVFKFLLKAVNMGKV